MSKAACVVQWSASVATVPWCISSGLAICNIAPKSHNLHFIPYNLYFVPYSLHFMHSPVCSLQIILTDYISSDIAIFIETRFSPLDPDKMCTIIFFQLY